MIGEQTSSPAQPRTSTPRSSGGGVATIRVLLADDHTLMRDVLGERLGRESDIDVVAKACDANEAVTLAHEHRPDVVLMDIDMPGMVCFDAAERMMERDPQVRVVFLSAFFNDRYIEQALKIKARGYVTKREPAEQVIEAVRVVASGGVYYSEDVRSRMVLGGDQVVLGEGKTRASMLTPRELEVLRYVARGMSKKEIAAVMAISVKTIENHCGSLMNKLSLHDRVALARYAIREGLAEA